MLLTTPLTVVILLTLFTPTESLTLEENVDARLDVLLTREETEHGIVLPKPEFYLGDGYSQYFMGGTIKINEDLSYLPYIRQDVDHEFCHYIQDKVCRFKKGGESFCTVYSRLDNSDCVALKAPEYYCYPYRLEDTDRDAFVDCVFEEACAQGGASAEELDECYLRARRDKDIPVD